MSTKNSELHSFADDNSITSFSDTLSQLIKDLKSEQIRPQIGLRWIIWSQTLKNLKQSKLKKGKKNPTAINIDGKKINSESSVLLLGLEIDSKLNFNKCIYKPCNKSASELNALNR